MSYPKWIYSRDGEKKIVKTAEEHEAHPGWAEHPDGPFFVKPKPVVEAVESPMPEENPQVTGEEEASQSAEDESDSPAEDQAVDEQPVRRGRGRPPGSKNRPKE